MRGGGFFLTTGGIALASVIGVPGAYVGATGVGVIFAMLASSLALALAFSFCSTKDIGTEPKDTGAAATGFTSAIGAGTAVCIAYSITAAAVVLYSSTGATVVTLLLIAVTF